MCAGSLRDVERLLGGRLHGRGQLVAGDPRFQVGLARVLLEVPAVEPVEEGEVLPLQARRASWGGGSRLRIRGSCGRSTVP